jgi:hypothetical protein
MVNSSNSRNRGHKLSHKLKPKLNNNKVNGPLKLKIKYGLET